MKILALQGSANSGKTTSIILLMELLEKDGAIILKDLKKRGARERTLIMEYHGRLIGITSLGDLSKYLADFFSKTGHCDLCVCACRSRGGTLVTIQNCAKEDDYFFLFKRKNIVEAELENTETAERLFSMINWIMNDLEKHPYQSFLNEAHHCRC